MKLSFIKLATVLLAALAAIARSETQTSEFVTALVKDGRLVCLSSDQSVTAWSLSDRRVDDAWTRSLSALKPVGIAAGANCVWCFDGKSVRAWSPSSGAITSIPVSVPVDEYFNGLAELGQEVYLILSERIVAVKAKKDFSLPEMGGQLKKSFLRPRCLEIDGHSIWIGNGYGEWGGNLVKFNADTGQWCWNNDPLHYPTGITVDSAGTVWVTWSMSHMMADTKLRSHNAEAQRTHDFPERKGSYYQTLSYSTSDDVLYAVEQSRFGTFDKLGDFHAIADLGPINYPRESKAVGVTPGIIKIIPVKPKTVIVVYAAAPPVIVVDGRVTPFEAASAPQPSGLPESK